MDAADFDYPLPEASIAQTPCDPRDAARLLVDRGPGAVPRHLHVSDLPSLIRPGDLVVLNDTGVLNARLNLSKPTGGQVEVLLLEPLGSGPLGSGPLGSGPLGSGPLGSGPHSRWEALVRPSKRVPTGTRLLGTGLEVVVEDDLGEGRRIVTLLPDQIDEPAAIAKNGELPLPPYIHAPLTDPDRYQTVYRELDERWDAVDPSVADTLQSVAAPTAGLHLTPALCRAVEAAGARIAMVRLAVGLGTFRPITAQLVEEHRMHSERYSLPPGLLDDCAAAGRVIAVGTTVVRALEAAAATGDLAGRTDLFIHGDYEFQVVDAMLTNFHVPRSSLLVMIDAFIGPRWRDLYTAALAEGYRFLSFGDAMFLVRAGAG